MRKLFFCSLFLITANVLFAQNEPTLAVGDKAPELKVKEWVKNESKAYIENGQISVVEFWATWCAPCIANFPHLSDVAKTYEDKNVKVFGISVMERQETSIETIRDLVKSKGSDMDYVVGIDTEAGYMASNWLRATGNRGIPFALIVDKSGNVAWMGHPKDVDEPLEKMVSGNWDLEKEAVNFKERRELLEFENGFITQFNSYMNGNKAQALKLVDSILEKHPKLKYYPIIGHYTSVSLLDVNQEKAVEYVRNLWKNIVTPNWKSFSDSVIYGDSQGKEFSADVYLLAIESLQAQLDNYPWSMNFPETYRIMAEFYKKAGKPDEAQKIMEKAEEAKN